MAGRNRKPLNRVDVQKGGPERLPFYGQWDSSLFIQ